MRILAVTHLYPTPLQPTLASFNRQQFVQLARLHDLTVVRPVPWPIALSQWARGQSMEASQPASDFPIYYPTYYYLPRFRTDLFGPSLEFSVRTCVEQLIAEKRPDAMLTSWAHPDGWASLQLARRAGLPVVLKVLGSDILVLPKGKRGDRIVETLQGVDRIVAVSEDLAHHVVKLGAPADRVHVVPEGISDEVFSPGDQTAARAKLSLTGSKKLILFVGNLLTTKGVVDLVAACARLRDRGVEFMCRIVGQGQDSALVEREIAKQKLSELVVCVGPRPHADLVHWFRASDVVTLPSYTEGIPNVLREALACGKPFVSTTVGGIPEIADPSFSRLIQPGSVEDLSDALAAMLASPPVVTPEAVRRINISWETSARMLADHLGAAVESRSRTR